MYQLHLNIHEISYENLTYSENNYGHGYSLTECRNRHIWKEIPNPWNFYAYVDLQDADYYQLTSEYLSQYVVYIF